MSGSEIAITISVLIIALAFVVLVVYAVKLFCSLQTTTETLNRKIHSLDAYFNIAENVGDKIERCICQKEIEREEKTQIALDVMEWVLVGAALWQKFKQKK